jgi:beta-fructofuranosidase
VTVPYARYETVAPSAGDVLASTVEGDADAVSQMATVAWEPDAGRVLGIGSAVSFRRPTGERCQRNREQLLAAALQYLAAGESAPLSGRPKDAATLSAMRSRLDSDTHRPAYHLTPPANWLNDPNGLVHWNGRYHVFYQYNPTGPFHNTIHWGHAVSDDLVHWRDEPVALSPSPDGPDRDGCWSGCAVDDDGTATILYTGGRGASQLPCLATAADDDLASWVKAPDNPVIDAVPSEPSVLRTEDWDGEFRDHCVWREDGRWHQLIGTGITDTGGAALLYTSEDLRKWRYEGPFLVGDRASEGTVWECPELLDLGDRQLLHVSNYEDVIYFLGEVRNGRFETDHRGTLDHGDFYAPQSLGDGDRQLTFGWLPEARDLSAQWDAGWSGALSLPRVISTGPDGRLRQHPAEAVTALRDRNHADDTALSLEAGEHRALEASGHAVELQLDVSLDDATAFELAVFESPDGEERTPIRYTKDGELTVDRSAASSDHRVTTDTQRMQITPYDEPLSLRCFLDESVIELYANERHCLTSRVYPTRDDSTGISVAAEGGKLSIESLSSWTLSGALEEPTKPVSRQ